MTIINIHFSEDRAFMASDTLAFDRDMKPALHGSKMAMFSVTPAVLACRGPIRLQHDAMRLAELRPKPQGLMPLVDDLPACLEASLAQCQAHESEPVEAKAHAWIVGWCKDERRMRGFNFLWADGFKPVEIEPGTYLNPAFAEDAPAVLSDPAATFAKVAALQQKMMREQHGQDGVPGCGIGGDLQIVEMTPTAMRIRTIYTFQDSAGALREMETA